MPKKESVPDVLQEVETAQNTIAVAVEAMSDDRDLMNQLLGQIQMSDAFSKFSLTVSSTKLAYVKENQLYKNLKGKKTANGSQLLQGTWEEFCQLLNISRQKADFDIANLRAFGEEALESMTRMGIGYRELRQFRKLPEDEKQALIEVAKEGDKEGFAEVAETIMAKHAKEKEALAKQLEDSKASYEALSKVTEQKSRALDKSNTELEKTKKKIAALTPVEVGEQIRDEAKDYALIAEKAIRNSLQSALHALTEHGLEHNINHKPFMAGLVAQVSMALNELKITFSLEGVIDDDPTPPWQREEALAEAEAAIDALPAIGDNH